MITRPRSISCMVGLAGFEPASIAPEATSLDQASRQPPFKVGSVFSGFIE